MVVLDTNVYLDIDRDAALAGRVADFVAEHPTAVGLSSVVVAELLIGVASEEDRAGSWPRRFTRSGPRTS